MKGGGKRQEGEMDSPLKHFAELRDPRIERNREHLLEEMLPIAIAAVHGISTSDIRAAEKLVPKGDGGLLRALNEGASIGQGRFVGKQFKMN